MTFWRFSTGYQVSYDINNQLNYLLDVFEGKVDELKEIKEEYGICFYFKIVINVENGDKPAIYFEKRFISFAAQIEAEVDVDWYIYS